MGAGDGARPRDAQAGTDVAGSAGPPRPGPFQDAVLNQVAAALAAGDTSEVDRAIRALAESREGQAFVRMGEEALARGEEAREAISR